MPLTEKRRISYLSLHFYDVELESDYVKTKIQEQLQPYGLSLVAVFIISLVAFIQVGRLLDTVTCWSIGGVSCSILFLLGYILASNSKYFGLIHTIKSIVLSLGITSINFIYFYQEQSSSKNSLLFSTIQESLYLSLAFTLDSPYFLLDISLLCISRIPGAIFYQSLLHQQEIIICILFYGLPLLMIANRYAREFSSKIQFLKHKKHSQWETINDNMYSEGLIMARWDTRMQTIDLLKSSTNIESKFRVFDGETMREFFSRIEIDSKKSDTQLKIPLEVGKKLTLKHFLLWRCVHNEQQSYKVISYPPSPNRKNLKLTPLQIANQVITPRTREQSESASIPKRARAKSQPLKNQIEGTTLIGHYYKEKDDHIYTRIFRIRIANFKLDDSTVVISLEDVTYLDEIKMNQEIKSSSDKLLLHTLNELRIKLVKIIANLSKFEADEEVKEKNEDALENTKFHTYLSMNVIYTLFDYFSISEKKGLSIKMAQFSLKKMTWDLVGMFQSQCKLKGIDFTYKNEIGRVDKAYSDERRIKQILITLLAKAVEIPFAFSILFKVSLDQKLRVSQQDSPTINHQSLKFEIEINKHENKYFRTPSQLKETRDYCKTQSRFNKQQQDDGFENIRLSHSDMNTIENKVIDELVKALGPYSIKLSQENNQYIMSFAIYIDFANLRKEERLHSLVRPDIQLNYSLQKQRLPSKSQQSQQSTQFNQLSNSNIFAYEPPDSGLLKIKRVLVDGEENSKEQTPPKKSWKMISDEICQEMMPIAEIGQLEKSNSKEYGEYLSKVPSIEQFQRKSLNNQITFEENIPASEEVHQNEVQNQYNILSIALNYSLPLKSRISPYFKDKQELQLGEFDQSINQFIINTSINHSLGEYLSERSNKEDQEEKKS